MERNSMHDMSPLISIFIPVYNGEKFLRRTLDSLLAQSFKDFEAVCVDDSSTDQSFALLKEYEARDERIRIYQKPNGGNVPKSWIFVLPYLKGEYILYSSQDDFISADLLQQMYRKAIQSRADAVIPCLIRYHGTNKHNPIKKGLQGNMDAVLSGHDAFLYSLDWTIHAFVLWKATLVRSIGFDDLATNSDEYATRLFFLHSNKVVFSEGIFYYNQENPEAITAKISVKRFDWCITNRRLLQMMQTNSFSRKEIASFAYTVWGNTAYQHLLFRRHRQLFDRKEVAEIKRILEETYNAIDWDIIAENYGIKGKVIRLCFSHGFAVIGCFLPLYALTLKK